MEALGRSHQGSFTWIETKQEARASRSHLDFLCEQHPDPLYHYFLISERKVDTPEAKAIKTLFLQWPGVGSESLVNLPKGNPRPVRSVGQRVKNKAVAGCMVWSQIQSLPEVDGGKSVLCLFRNDSSVPKVPKC